MDFYRFLSAFNEKQRAAIEAPPGHLAINAAAGTGKTSTLAARILYMQLEMDVPSDSILAISFSRTARMRLSEKLSKYCMEVGMGNEIPIYTFHGLAYRILRLATAHDETWLKANFEVLQPHRDGSNDIYRKHGKYLFESIPPVQEKVALMEFFPKILDELRQGSDDMVGISHPDEIPLGEECQWSGEHNSLILKTDQIKVIWKKYNGLLAKNNMIDYSGLITEATNALRHPNGETRRRASNGIKYILADEYQDTSRAQEQLLFALAGNDSFVNIVGDPGQTIYSFNGSSVSNILEFSERITAVSSKKVLDSISLTENYRSSENILKMANRVRGNGLYTRPLVPAAECFSSPLVDYRSRNEPVRIIHAPTIELAADFIATEIQRLTKEEKIPLDEICILVRKDTPYSPQGKKVKDRLEQQGLAVSFAKETEQDNSISTLEYLSDVFMQPEYYGMPISEFLDHRIGTISLPLPENVTIEDIRLKVAEYCQRGFELCYEISDDIQDSLDIEPVEEIRPGNVHIRTIHSAKGEEFRIVFLGFLGDTSFPHGSRPDIEEEKRLLYVGITRAQERLYVLGHPGIHHESFLDKCKGDGSINNEHFSLSTASPVSIDMECMDPEAQRIINETRRLHAESDKQQREELWKIFDEDYQM